MRKTLLISTVIFFVAISSSFAKQWGYEGQAGVYTPGEWYQVSSICNEGKQSPIDINSLATVDVGSIRMEFGSREGMSSLGYHPVSYPGEGVLSSFPGARTLMLADGSEFSLIHMHFHTLSEHTVNGKHCDMEMHLVHADGAALAGDLSGRLVVFGVLIKKGKKNEALEDILSALSNSEPENRYKMFLAKANASYDDLLPDSREVYSYQGSLTAPGCNEIVTWFVFKNPIELSAAQIDLLRDLYRDDVSGKLYNTNRPVQPLGDRVVSSGYLFSGK